jgi:carboxyl-terminal processing protease
MRRFVLSVGLWLVTVPAFGAPIPAASPMKGIALPPAQQFAVQLHQVAEAVNLQYVRPVPVPELLHAALSGIYEAARMPVPVDLKKRIEAAAARGELIPLIQETHVKTADSMTALGRNPLPVACQALFRSLDPYSGIVNREEQRRNVAMEQTAQGVGLDLFDYAGTGPLVVKIVFPGGAAQRAGIRPGDQITQVNGEAVEKTGADPKHAARLALLQGSPDEWDARHSFDPLTGLPTDRSAATGTVKVSFRRPGGLPRTVELERQHFRVETVLGVGRDDGHRWHYWADRKNHIAHVRISVLSHGTSDELAAVLDRLLADGMRGLVLDLRWTPGGWLDQSVDVARLFLGEVPVATIKSRGAQEETYRGGGPSKLLDLPLVVLVNGETSGGAELIAAALQDHHRAVIVGQRTLGKGSVQRPLGVSLPGLELKVTTGTFFRPNGKNLHRFPESKTGDDWGVKPDVDFRVSPSLGRQLKEWWIAQTLRPGPSMERLPLDDPRADPQRNAAVEAALEKLRK